MAASGLGDRRSSRCGQTMAPKIRVAYAGACYHVIVARIRENSDCLCLDSRFDRFSSTSGAALAKCRSLRHAELVWRGFQLAVEQRERTRVTRHRWGGFGFRAANVGDGT